MRVANIAQAKAKCPRSPYTTAPHEWGPIPAILANGPEQVAFICKWCLLAVTVKTLDDMG